VRRLATLLGLEFSFPIMHKRTYGVSAYPELQLLSLLIIATKLSHPFDDVERVPQSEDDPTTVKVDWEIWREIMAEAPTKGLKRGTEIKITDIDVMNMTGMQMDDYLNWYQRTWIDDRDPKSELPTFPSSSGLLNVPSC
jgi:RNA polymerase I-specific transcription initiation factor RRN7